jgi:DNA replication protein DnaC
MSETNAKKAGNLVKPAIQEFPERVFTCPIHGTYRGKPFKFLWGFESKPITHFPECPKCVKERREQEKRKVEWRERQEEISRLKAMNIGEKFWDSTFENFNAYNDELKRYLDAAKRFAEKPAGKLVMIGENGNGKNHLTAAILKKTGGVIYTCFELGVMIRDCYKGKRSEAKLFNRLCNVPLLAIDELDKIKETEAKNNWMSHIIGKRYNNMLPLIFIANGHMMNDCKSPEKPCPKCLEYHLENDIISRVFEDGILLKFTSPDYRYYLRGKRKV